MALGGFVVPQRPPKDAQSDTMWGPMTSQGALLEPMSYVTGSFMVLSEPLNLVEESLCTISCCRESRKGGCNAD